MGAGLGADRQEGGERVDPLVDLERGRKLQPVLLEFQPRGPVLRRLGGVRQYSAFPRTLAICVWVSHGTEPKPRRTIGRTDHPEISSRFPRLSCGSPAFLGISAALPGFSPP